MISIKNVDLIFETNDGPVQALKNVSLEVEKGDFVSFIGPSGCGKTTLLRAIAALEIPTKGNLTVNGKSPDSARIDREYGYVFQAAGLYPWRTVEGNIKLPLEIMGYSQAEKKERIQKVIELVELKGFEKKFPWQLSGGSTDDLATAVSQSKAHDDLIMDDLGLDTNEDGWQNYSDTPKNNWVSVFGGYTGGNTGVADAGTDNEWLGLFGDEVLGSTFQDGHYVYTVVAGGGTGSDVYPPVVYVVDVENAVDFNNVLEP